VAPQFEGKTLDLAVDNACQALGIDKQQLTYAVIEKGSSGIFGLVGTRKARIQVVLPQSTPPMPVRKTEANDLPAADGSAAGLLQATADVGQARLPADQNAARRLGTQALQRLVDAITAGASVACHHHNGHLAFTIKGGNQGLLSGKHGQTLEALQHLADKIINRAGNDRIRVQVDVEGYLEKRAQTLKQMASRLAAQARRSGTPQTLAPLSAFERRIIHTALKNDTSVRTQSQGEGPERKLVIYPRHAPSGTGSRRRQASPNRSGNPDSRPKRPKPAKPQQP